MDWLVYFLIVKEVYVNKMLLGDINKYCFKMAICENCIKILTLNFLLRESEIQDEREKIFKIVERNLNYNFS